ncbi:MAG: TIM barrel protein [Candidatus Poribacteria bacterium]|nr:TIM barrel protein [Candidatus Poribacteria bacterium]
MSNSPTEYRFSFGPWNIHEGADPFGPPVRESYSFDEKVDFYRDLGFLGIQFHDDDVVPDIDEKTHAQLISRAKSVKTQIDNHGLTAEVIAPRLWESSLTIDGAFTSNSAKERQYALERSKRCVDIANVLECKNFVLWLAREGTYIRETKSSSDAVGQLLDAINALLDYDPEIRILIEPKPNEPMDIAYIPTIGHAIGLAYASADSDRVGGLIESAHAILAGLEPSDEMGYALYHNKLWSVHLNDQNGLKFDQDKAFGSANLRRAFNQVRVLEENGYGRNGEYIGLDVKVMRTQPRDISTKHLLSSRRTFLNLLEKVRTLDRKVEQEFIAARDYEGLDFYILEHLLGK